MIGKNLGHYRILTALGKGGMGEVWVAEDTRLNRKVALKTLPPEMAADPDRRARFEREAQAIAALNHPNIVTIHSVEEIDGVAFITMELIDGEQLTQRITTGGQALGSFLEIAIPLASALAAAHRKGITHRDVKPDNVMITRDGHLKVLDFGLAKLASNAGPDDAWGATRTAVTAEGKILGTVSYMSPEQAEGKPVDARSDVFSLGVVLYQLATGQPPFQGDTPISTITAILRDTPTRIGELKPAQPAVLDRIVTRCLQKAPEARYQTAEELRDELVRLKELVATRQSLDVSEIGSLGDAVPAKSQAGRRTKGVVAAAAVVVLAAAGWWITSRDGGSAPAARPSVPATGAPAAPVDRKSVAVLPFENLSGDAEGEIFAAGIHDDILTQLAKIRELKTISRTSVVEYKNTTKSIGQIGKELGVAAVLEGGVRRAGNLVRINVKLIDAKMEENLWAESYDRELSAMNIFAIQSEIASAIAGALRAELSPSERKSLAAVPTASLEAYDLYLRGNEYIKRPGNENEYLLKAEEVLQRAVQLDPDFALAHAALSEVYSDLFWVGGEPTEERLAQAFECARKAVMLAPERGETHLSLGNCFYLSRDYDRAKEEYAIAAQTLPGDVELVTLEAAVTRRTGGWEESLPKWKRAMELAPRDAQIPFETGLTYNYLGRYDEAESYYRKALALAPDYHEAKVYLAIARTDREPTVASFRRELASLDPDEVLRAVTTGYAWRVGLPSGDHDRLFALLAPAGEMLSQQEYDYPKELLLGITYQLAGDRAAANAAFRTAAQILEDRLADRPDYAPHRGALGLAYAGFGMKEDAVREARSAVKLLPVERDGLVGSWQLADLAFVYVAVGEYEAAVDTFERYLAHPALFSAGALAMDPRNEPLRDHPRFRKLVDPR